MDKDMQKQAVELLSVAREGVLLLKGAAVSIDDGDIAALREAVASADALCKAGLTGRRYAYYHDIFDGCLMSIARLAGFVAAGENIGEVCDLIADLLSTAEENLLKERTKKEIVFLPYKASMWDSLESIWLAARDDDSCTALVVPIPYCDRNPDGSAREWHYEGAEFPKEVPITSYRKYNLVEHRPDVIYIHNPYDGCNYVTSVHPDYYSDKLKQYTDMLVYVPYDCTDGKHVSPHFPKLPGVVNADRVIVDNERIKELYIKHYPDPTKGREYFDEKFLPLGSPKIDKVKRSKREDFELPEKWASKIKGKRVILYNTHLSPLISTPEKQMAKIRCTFDVFKERKDMILWWRPHPLSEATLQSMRLDAYEEYMKLKQTYLDEDFGIYDNTADLYRSLTWTDAYYGDVSSVVWLYRATGKSVVIQNIDASIQSRMYRLAIHSFVCNKGILYFIDAAYGCLFSLDTNGNKICFLNTLGGANRLKSLAYGVVDGRLILAPWRPINGGFLEFDFVSNMIGQCSTINETEVGKLVFDIYMQGEEYLIFASQELVFVSYDISKKKYRVHDITDEVKGYLADFPDKIHNPMMGRGVIKGNMAIFPIRFSNVVVRVRLDTGEVVTYKIADSHHQYGAIYDDGASYWLIHSYRANSVIKWNHITDKIEEVFYKDAFKRGKYDLADFVIMCKVGGEVVFLPRRVNDLFAIDTHTHAMRSIRVQLSEPVKRGSCGYSYGLDLPNQIVALCEYNDKIVVIDKGDFTVREFDKTVLKDSFDQFKEKIYRSMQDVIIDESYCEESINILSAGYNYIFRDGKNGKEGQTAPTKDVPDFHEYRKYLLL